MSQAPQEIKFALSFPQGEVIFFKGDARFNGPDIGGIYFLPKNGDAAFVLYGERKELFGKNAVNVNTNNETGRPGYSVVWEFNEAGKLSDARAITKGQAVKGPVDQWLVERELDHRPGSVLTKDVLLRGVLTDAARVQQISDRLAAGEITLYGDRDTRPPSIFNVARFTDGRLLVQLWNDDQLYIGTPGNFTKLDARKVAQGGNSMYYQTATGENIELPWSVGGASPGQFPKFGDETLNYMDVPTGAPPSAVGLDILGGVKALDLFSAEVQPKAKAPAVKGPRL